MGTLLPHTPPPLHLPPDLGYPTMPALVPKPDLDQGISGMVPAAYPGMGAQKVPDQYQAMLNASAAMVPGQLGPGPRGKSPWGGVQGEGVCCFGAVVLVWLEGALRWMGRVGLYCFGCCA